MAGKAFGEQNPTEGETAVSWQTWSDGSGNVPTISGDADWGKLKLDLSGEEGRSAVYDLGSTATRKFTLTENRYGTGEEDATLQYRTDTSSFAQDDVSPAWTTYSAPFSVSCRYVQIREITQSIVTYYVDATGGDDDNTGLSPDQAWQTITKVNAASLNPGDHVFFKRGETFAGRLVPGSSGDAAQAIVYGAYGTGNRPIIDGSASSALYIANATYHHLRYENIDFSGTVAAGGVATVLCYTHDMYFYNCIFRDSADKSGWAAWSSTDTIYNITLDTCTSYDNYTHGYFLGGTTDTRDCLIVNCTAHTNGHDTSADHGYYVAWGTTIDRCTAYNNSGAGFKMNDNEIEATIYFPVVKNCISYGNNYGLLLTHKNALAYNNLVYNNNINLELYGNAWGGYKVYFNTFVNAISDTTRGVYFGAGFSPDSEFKNNLFIQDEAEANVYRSIIDNDGTLANLISNNTFDYNIYYWTGSTTAHLMYNAGDSGDESKDWTEMVAAGMEPHGTHLATTPDFVTRYTDLHPADAGDLKGLGVAISGYEFDKDGNARADPPTPGCYEEAAA